jgi:hypothetical protein
LRQRQLPASGTKRIANEALAVDLPTDHVIEVVIVVGGTVVEIAETAVVTAADGIVAVVQIGDVETEAGARTVTSAGARIDEAPIVGEGIEAAEIAVPTAVVETVARARPKQ